MTIMEFEANGENKNLKRNVFFLDLFWPLPLFAIVCKTVALITLSLKFISESNAIFARLIALISLLFAK